MFKTQYLYTKHKSGKIGITAHLSYDGKNPLCQAQPVKAGEFVLGELKDMAYVCGDCYRVATQGTWESIADEN
jgi:hypothetical protein